MGWLLPVLLAHAGGLGVAALLLASAGQPLFTEDTWLHLALGRAYAAEGPWLPADPLLHTAAGPPAPAAWLFGVALHGVEQLVGFQGLRVVHAAAVAGILILAWTLLRRASGSPAFASLGTGLFVVLSAYRLFQLRPHLFTIFAALWLMRLLLGHDPPSWRRVAAVAGVFALWANLHGGFVLGLVLLGAGVLGPSLIAISDPRERPRAVRLAAALGLGALATLANPAGPAPHQLYIAAGVETPALEVVADEWTRVALFELPIANLPPSPLAWATVWALLLATPVIGVLRRRALRREAALVAAAAVSLVGVISAVRLLWLGVVPLLLLGRAAAAPHRTSTSWITGTAAALLVPAFLAWGDWPMISRGVHPAVYGQPYTVGKHDVNAVWFLRDAGLEGNLYNDYASGNFLGYWLAPRLKAFVNGSLNVPLGVMEARAALAAREGSGDRSFTELLDHHGIDIFYGTGLPMLSRPGRPRTYTTTHLEGEPGWVVVFRSPASAVYLRRNGRNAENLARVVAYYERERVPFDPEAGFDPERVIQRVPRWATDHGIAPARLQQIEMAASALAPDVRWPAYSQLAALYALLGRYERSAALDRRLLTRMTGSVRVRGRRVWSLLHMGRVEESLEAAAGLEATASADDPLSQLLVAAARRHAELPENARAALLARTPFMTHWQGRRILAGFLPAEARLR